MKKKALFLAAGVAAVSASALANGSVFAAQQTIILETEDAIKIAQAIDGHSNVTNISYTESAAHPNEGEPAIIIGDDTLPSALIFDCSGGNPLEGVTDFSILQHSAFSGFESITLCGEDDNAPIDYGTLPNTLTSLTVGDPTTTYDRKYDADASRPKNINQLTNLNSVRLNGVQVGGLDGFKNMTNLVTLEVRYGGLDNISALKDLTHLSSLNLEGNNIENIDVLVSACMTWGDCDVSSWEETYQRQVFINAIKDNLTVIETPTKTAGLPEWFTALYDKFYGPEDAYKQYIEVEGLELSDDYGSITVTAADGIGWINIKDPGYTNKVKYTIAFVSPEEKEEESEESEKETKNPETGDHSIMGWAFGIAAAIFAGAGVVIRSRR